MSLQDLPPSDRVIVRQCLCAVAQGPFVDEWEFQTRLGAHREKVIAMLRLWPNINDRRDDSEDTVVINNCLNEICYGINIPMSEWSNWFAVPRSEIERIYKEWSIKRGWKRTGLQ